MSTMKTENLPLTIRNTWGLLKSQTAKNTYLSFLGNGLFSFFSMVCMILISRSLGPAQFGLFSVIFSFSIILFDVSSWGLDQGLIRFVSFNLSRKKVRRADAYAKAVFKIRLITAIALIIFGFFLAPFLSRLFFAKTDHQWLLTIVFVGMATTILAGGFISALLRARQAFFKDAVFHAMRGFFRAVLIGTLWLLNKLSLMNVALAFFLYNWATLPLVFLFIPRKFLQAKPSGEVYNKLFHFSKWVFLWALTATIHSKLDIFMLERMKGSYATGIYSAASRLLIIFLTLIHSFGIVLLPKIAAINNFAHFRSFFKKIILAVVGLILLIILAILLARPLVLLVFGDAYFESIKIFRLLLIGIIFMTLSLPFINSLTAWGKTKIIGLISTGQLILVALANFFLIKKFGGMGAAMTYNLSSIFALLLVFIFYLRELEFKRANY